MADHADVRREHGFHELTVRAVVQETADTRSFVLDVPDDLADLFHYRAGQFCTFRVHVDGDELLRSYSMSSSPEVGDPFTVTVKRVPGGRVSNWLNDHVAPGDRLELTKPAGVFCLGDGTDPVIAFCGGSGVTPVISIVKTALATTDRSVHVLYANRDAASVIFAGAFADLARAQPDRLTVRHHLDDDGGFLSADDIRAFAAATPGADVYLCGPTPFMDLVESTLLDAGTDPARIFIERFVNAAAEPAAPAAPAQPVETVDPDEGAAAGTAEDDLPARVTITLDGKTTEVPYQPGDTVLETARRGGLRPPFSCEAGNCATCMAMQHEGTATLRNNNALTADELAEGWILTCQAVPHGPKVTVEYEAM